MSRRVRRLIDVSKKKTGYVSQRDMDGSAHRLSKPADKFSANRAVPAEKPEPYCIVYFRNNPDAVDVRPPSDKLQDLFDKLDEDLEPSVKFTTLIQIKSAQYMLHGENSVEALRAHAQLGFFYNENLRPQSALRHLEKAHMLERTNTIEPEETIEIAVETAQAHISLRNDKKNNTTRHVAQAEDILRPYYDTEIETLHLKYKRDVVKARIFSAKKKYDEALELYETALGTLQEEYEGDETPEEAKLFVEMAETAALQNYRKRSGNYYRKAYDIFQSLGMEESAKNIEDKLPADDEFDDDEEEDNKYDNDDGENEGEYAPHPPDDDYSNRYQRNEYNDDTNNDDGEYAVAEPPPRYGDDNYEEEEERTFKVVEPPPRDLEEQQNNIAVGLLGDSGAPAEEDQPETLHFDMKDKLNNQGEEEDAGEARERALTSDQPAAESDQPAAESDQPAAESDQPAAESDQPAAESDQPAAESDQIAPENPESEHPDSEHPESEQPVAAESDHPPEDNVESDKPAEAD